MDARIVAIARTWIGTPYHHQACLKGVGTDCLGLVRGVWRELYGFDAEVAPAYSRDWAEASGIETMLEAANRHLVRVDPFAVSPGDVIVFRLRAGTVAKHAAIIAGGRGSDPSPRSPQPETRLSYEGSDPTVTMIHAMEGCPVAEVALGSWWRRRVAGAFRFPALPAGVRPRTGQSAL